MVLLPELLVTAHSSQLVDSSYYIINRQLPPPSSDPIDCHPLFYSHCAGMAIPRNLAALLLVSLSPLCFQLAAANFDIFALAIYRTAHRCAKYKPEDCCFANECCRLNSLPEFTIHSFWPNYANLTWPRCCTNSRLNQSEVATLIPTLVEYWPPLECGPSNHLSHCGGVKESLVWEHEWEVHGTCSSPVIMDPYSYFSKGLELYFKYDLEKLFNSAGFFGSRSNVVKYPLNQIIATVEKAVGASPIVECENGSLMQIWLCFEKDYTPRACGSASSISCPEYISLATTGRSASTQLSISELSF